tara:strand:- start:107 stop:571 length:465 start_codon:yes stop_codon:yes gene_type:complete
MDELMKSDELKMVLENALSNDANERIMNMTREKMNEYKTKLFDEINISKTVKKDLLEKLELYRYIDDINDFKEGSYIRWINLTKINDINKIKLETGGYISEIKMLEDDVHIVCKLLWGKRGVRHIELLGGNNLIFQKLTEQEQIILSVLEYLNK